MLDALIKETDDLFKKLKRLGKFYDRYRLPPIQETGELIKKFKQLAEISGEAENPKNNEELLQSELKRRLNGAVFSLENWLGGRHYDFDTIISLYGIPKSDISSLRPWLESNKNKILESIERLFNRVDVKSYEFLPLDIPSVKRQAEEFAAVHIQKYHKKLGKLIENLTNVGEYLRDVEAVPTVEDRSYFSNITKTLAIAIPKVCYTIEDGSLHIRERELIRIYGHEGMAHALNKIITDKSNLPYFLKFDAYATTTTSEAVAQFYERLIFEDLKESPETQKELGIRHIFDEIHQEAMDIAQLEDYNFKLFQYSITVLADKNLGDVNHQDTIKKKTELISQVAVHPNYALDFVERNRHNFDSRGNLSMQLVSELRYCAQPVQRALDEFVKAGIKYEGSGRSIIDRTFLTGFWTPIGFVDNARLAAQGKL